MFRELGQARSVICGEAARTGSAKTRLKCSGVNRRNSREKVCWVQALDYQAGTTLGTTSGQNFAAVGGSHAGAETVRSACASGWTVEKYVS